MKQIVRIAAQGGLSNTTDSLLVQEPVDPRHVPTGVVGHAKRALGVAQSMRLSYPESAREAPPKEAVKLIGCAAADEEAIGIVALGQGDPASRDTSFPKPS